MTFEVEAFYNFDTIKSFGIAPHYSRLMRWWQGKFKDVSLEYNMFSIKTNILLSVMGTGVEFIAFGYCLFLLWTHTITYGTMTLFLQQRSNLSGAFNNVVSIIPSFLNSSVSAHRIRELVELPKEVHISESEELDPFAEDGFEVLMKDVNFAYVEGTRVITDSYFKACPGEIVALVGPSGEGKTTMIRLILGLIRPQEGEAVINKYSNGDVLNRFNGDIGTVSSNAISWLPTIVIAIYNFIATFLVILHYNAVMAILALASAPFMLLMSRFMIKKQREYSQKTREMSSKLMTFEVEAFYNFDTIKSFGIAPHYSRLMRWWQGKFKDVSLEYNMFSIKTNILLSVMGTGVEFIAFGYCLFLLWTHTITYGTMTLFLQQRSNLSGAFNNVVSIIPSFLNSSVSAHRIRELVELPKEVHISESEELDPFAEDGFEVLMKDVNFAYVEGTRVITDSYFKACPGEIVALVGPSGEGKTTMIRLILGLIRPQEGEAVIVASNGREIVLNAETRHFFAYVPQGNTILSGTIAENMRMVKEDATDEEIIEALKIACAWDFVEKLPDTINSALGERGRGLSEGQAQRISIARAVLRNAPILLLDEATSALDVTTERKVLRNIIEQKPNKTCIVTTHRPSVLNMCQRVYRVMETKVTELDEEESSRMAMDF